MVGGHSIRRPARRCAFRWPCRRVPARATRERQPRRASTFRPSRCDEIRLLRMKVAQGSPMRPALAQARSIIHQGFSVLKASVAALLFVLVLAVMAGALPTLFGFETF